MEDKDFRKFHNDWNKKAKELDSISLDTEEAPYFEERQIWWCSVGSNIGSEIQGKGTDFSRPVLILRKINSHLFWGVPLTSNKKTNRVYTLGTTEYGIAISQVRALSPKRFLKREGYMNYKDFQLTKLDIVKRICSSEEDYLAQKEKNKRAREADSLDSEEHCT